MRRVRLLYDGMRFRGSISPGDDRVKLDLCEEDSPVPVPRAPVSLEDCQLLAPCQPSKIVAVGLNYRDHAAELGFEIPKVPLLFIKAPTTVIGHGESIVYPPQSVRVEYEAELAVVIGRKAWRVSPEEAVHHIGGYTCALDITARDLQLEDGQWTRAKNFDTFCPLGPWVEDGVDPSDLAISLALNGENRQSSRTSQLIFGVAELVSFISSIMTLHPDDVVLTGTPAGVGEIHPGDRVEVVIEGIGKLLCGVIKG